MVARVHRVDRIRRISQIALGAVWLIDGALQFQPVMFGKGFVTSVILPNADGQPGIVALPLTWIAHDIQPHVALFNALAASLQVTIGLALMFRRTVKPALAVSFIWAASIWFAGEGLGAILTGTASPLTGAPGAALLYIVAGALVWPSDRAGELGGLGGRLAWSALWLSSAVLWLLPANRTAGSVHDAIAAAPSGAGWLTDVLQPAASAAGGHGPAIALGLAVLSAAIALSALTRRAERTFLSLAIALNLAYWVLGQGLGGIFTGSATDLSTAPLVILLGCILLAQRRAREPEGHWVATPAGTSSSAAAVPVGPPSGTLTPA